MIPTWVVTAWRGADTHSKWRTLAQKLAGAGLSRDDDDMEVLAGVAALRGEELLRESRMTSREKADAFFAANPDVWSVVIDGCLFLNGSGS